MAEPPNGKVEPIPSPESESQGNTEAKLDINDQEESGETTGLHVQALLAILGNYIDQVGPILSLIGLGTITSAIGGYFSRSPPALFTFVLYQDDSNIDRKAVSLYYKCLPAFIIVGLLELWYGMWVSRNHPVRAGKVAKAILLLSAIALVVTMSFTGAGVSI